MPLVVLALTSLVLLMPAHGAAAETLQQAVDEARRLRDQQAFAEAVKVLERHLLDRPDDAEAARLYAQTLYWLQDHARARTAYAAALARHPGHQGLRLEYARMLADTGDHRGAVQLLKAGQGAASVESEALLGTVLYWSGDLTGARKSFIKVLDKDPSHQEAARQLREIDAGAAPWLRLSPSLWHDDQPLDRSGIAGEAGWYATPLLSIAFRSQPDRYASEGSRTFWRNEVELSHFAPAARLETRLAAGIFRREADSLEWIGRGELAFRAGGGVTLRGRVERSPYLYTRASLDAAVTTTGFAGIVQWTHPRGWLAEGAIARQRFPDANQSHSAYAWALAPVLRRGRSQLQAGYAIAAADTDEDRFVLARPEQPLAPSDPGFDFSGAYRPYYTPAGVLTHSLLAGITLAGATGLTLRGDGSYGFRAHEDTTAFFALADQVGTVTTRRSFRPWTLRASLESPAARAIGGSLRAESGRTAFYRWTTVSVHVLFRFLPRGAGRPQSQQLRDEAMR